MKVIESYLQEMNVTLANDPKAVEQSWQAPFKEETKCCKCGADARLAFTCKEEGGEKEYVSSMYDNKIADGGEAWPHDAIAVAVYFCKKCLETTSEYNQG